MNNTERTYSIYLILIIVTVTYYCSSQSTNIIVNDEKGVDNSLCLDGKGHCLSLDFVFLNLSDCHKMINKSINVTLLEGNYSFTLNSTLTGGLFKNCSAINIVGANVDSTNIVCGVDAGLAFQNIPQVNIANITFTHCGSLRNSTSVNLANNPPNKTLLLSVALYFTYCKNIQIVNVIVQDSITTGIVMYNIYGNLYVEGSLFNGNGNEESPLPSNGGFHIEFVYCDPGKVDENCTQRSNSYATYHFKSNTFNYNFALNKFEGTLFYLFYKTKYYSFSRGGGLSIVFKGNASNNNVVIDDCKFYGNKASRGGGLLIEFEDFSNSNKIIINNTNFSYNQVVSGAKNSYGTAGGGVRVGFVIFDKNTVEYNSIVFENCLFRGNHALWGGGSGIFIPSEPNVVNATNSLSFNNCSWAANKGLLGSAVDLDYWNIHNYGAKMQVLFSACKFHNNSNSKMKEINTITAWHDFNSFGAGTLYANGIPIIFEEYVEFNNNNGSALAVYDTTATFASNCNASFVDNTAWEGGAIILLGASNIWINPHTIFLFKNNKANLRGGAIYALQTSRHDLISDGNCFLQYNDISVSSPNKWKTNFTFENNYAPTGSSIFVTSLLSCAWSSSFKDLKSSISNALNWNNFKYHPLSNRTIATEISNISLKMNLVTLIPGKYTELPITTVDDKGNDVSQSFWLVSKNDSVKLDWNISDNSYIILLGKPNSESSIEIVTDSPRVISTSISVKLAECPPGFYFNVDKCQCSYLNKRQRVNGILSCDSENFTAKIKRGYWAGYHLSSEHPNPTDMNLVTGHCPRHYCDAKEQEIYLPNKSDATLLNEQLCTPVNRNGALCGRCSNGHGVAINSIYFDCINCSHWLSQHGWIMYVLTEYVPSTLLFFFVLFFDINLHSGTISTIILYFQIFDFLNIYSGGDITPPLHSNGLFTFINFIYNLWNLEFFGFLLPLYCINTHFNTMDVFLIKYISGLYPFLLFLLFIAFSNLVYVNCCYFNKVAKFIRDGYIRLKFKINRKRSTVNGLATLWTLVFTKFAVISALILTQETLSGSENSNITIKVAWLSGDMPYFGKTHWPYAIPALIILVFLVIIPAICLFSYPLVPQLIGMIEQRCDVNFNDNKFYKILSSKMQRPFTYLKPLIDCFQGSCKPRCEFFAGLLFMYRISIVFVFSFTVQVETIFYNLTMSILLIIITAILQPYEKPRDNIVTILSISNILFINVLKFCFLYWTDMQSNRDLQPWLWLQVFMILLPFIFFVAFSVQRSWLRLKAFWKQIPLDSHPTENDELNFPVRALEDSTMSNTCDYNGYTSPQLSSAGSTGTTQNVSEVSKIKSYIDPVADYGSCGNQIIN